ncbi:tetratricopeptide repeat protein, partial [Rhodobacterales bacterium HKCCE3408]|nr:tetratricopeptide repeat protein [Rhodobacterales bacterium HKCCE3408]
MAATGGDIQTKFQRALTLQKAGRGAEALALYTEVVMMRPGTAEAHFQIGRIHASAGRLDKARAALVKALALRPAEPAIWAAIEAVSPDIDRDAALNRAGADLPPDAQAALGAALRS